MPGALFVSRFFQTEREPERCLGLREHGAQPCVDGGAQSRELGLVRGAILAGWAFAQRPDFLPGELTLQEAAAGDATLTATLVALVVALLVIVPSIALLYRLTLVGRLSGALGPIVDAEDVDER